MGSIVADTHAVIWYLAASPKLSPIALASLEATAQAGDVIYIASISLVEVIYLAEKGRLPEIALQRLSNALTDPATSFAVVPLDFSDCSACSANSPGFIARHAGSDHRSNSTPS